MKLEQLIEDIKAEHPNALAGVPEAAAAKLLRAAFRVVHKHITGTVEGAVAVPGLGNFKAKLHKKKDAAETDAPVRRVAFVAAAAPGEKRDRAEARAAKGKAVDPEREAKRAERQAARQAAGKPARKKAAAAE